MPKGGHRRALRLRPARSSHGVRVRARVVVLLALCLIVAGALWASLAAGAGSKTITCDGKPKETTKAIEKAVEEGGTYVLQCGGEPIQVPKPEKNPTGGLAPGFKIAAKKSVTFEAPEGDNATFENEADRHSRIFTIASGGSLTLVHINLSATAAGPQGIAAGKAKTNGQKGEQGEYGEEPPEEVEEGKEENPTEGEEGSDGANYSGEETNSDGGDGGRGTDGGLVGGKALNAPTAEGGAISNAGTLTLEGDTFQGDYVVGGSGGQGGSGGSGGAGGSGGGAGDGSGKAQCGQQGEGTVEYLATPPGGGGDGGRGGDGGPGTPAGHGGEAKGGAIYNTGTLAVKGSTFAFDAATGGIGGEGGSGGGGGNGGSGGEGNPGGEGGAGGNAGNGEAAGNGANGRGGAIYNTGHATIEGSEFSEDLAEGGIAGSGGGAGSAGSGGGGAEADPFDVCENDSLKLRVPPGGDGGEGGMGAEGGAGGSGGSAEGGAIYNSGSLTFVGTNNLSNNFVVAGVGATVEQCKEKGGPCPGKGSAAGEGGEGGGLGEPVGSKGNAGPGGGASGKPGFNGVALGEGIFGASSGTTPEEVKTPGAGPGGNPGSNSNNSSSSSKSGGGGKGGDDEDNNDDNSSDSGGGSAKVSDTGKTQVKENGSTIIIETGEVVSCPPGTGECTMIVSATTTEVKVPAGAPADAFVAPFPTVTFAGAASAHAASAHKRHHAKPKPLVVGHATIVVPAGGSAKVSFKLTAQGAARLRKHHHLRITVTVEATRPGQAPVKHTGTITISAPKPVKHHKKG